MSVLNVKIGDNIEEGWWYSTGDTFEVLPCINKGQLLNIEGVDINAPENYYIVVNPPFKGMIIQKSDCIATEAEISEKVALVCELGPGDTNAGHSIEVVISGKGPYTNFGIYAITSDKTTRAQGWLSDDDTNRIALELLKRLDIKPPEEPNFFKISDAGLIKLGSALVHADEYLSPDGHDFDRTTFYGLLKDPEVSEWIKRLSEAALLPQKRKKL